MHLKLSVVFDEKKIALLQVDKNQPANSAFIDNDIVESSINALQRAVQDMQADKSQVSLGIPHKDVILRSFNVPEMSSTELSKAITFEIKKYIPFSIAEAYYSTVTSPFIDNGNKMMRVVFYAARKTTINQYIGHLQQVGLTVTHCEPAICGLVRMMIFRKDIYPADKIALLDIRAQKAVIYFIDAGVVKFLREIPLSLAADEAADSSEAKMRFLNEVHNSFDFYYRQFDQRVDEMLVAGNEGLFSSIDVFMGADKVKCRKYSFGFVSGLKSIIEVSMCAAYGLGLSGNMFVPPINFLSVEKPPKKNIFDSLLKKPMDMKLVLPLLRMAVVMAVCLIGLKTFLWFQINNQQQVRSQLAGQQAEFAALSVEELQGKIAKVQLNLQALGKIAINSNLHEILVLVSRHMPEQMWLQDISLSEGESPKGLVISLKAMVYSPDINQQVKLVNVFLNDLRADKELAAYIPKWQLKAMNRQQYKNKTVTVVDLSNG